MTEILEPGVDAGDLDALEKSVLAPTGAIDNQQSAEGGDGDQPNSDPGDQIPEKYQGKTAAEIAEMHMNLERAYGRMADDYGQQRKLTDQLLDLKRTQDLSAGTAQDPSQGGEGEPEVPDISAAEILDNPTAALERYYEARRARDDRELTERLNTLETGIAQERFISKHSDYEQVANDPKFVEWIQSSSLRTRVAQEALEGDWQAADDLVSEFKATSRQTEPNTNQGTQEQNSDEAALEEAKKASLESGASAESGASGGKKYRRSDLIRMKIERPHIYESEDFQQEIFRAYKEGRVI